jgi:hypothetical protein
VTNGPRQAGVQVVICVCVSVAVLVPAPLTANIFPWINQWHGWPLTYMVREWRVPGGLTILYGPWPLDNPPLVALRPAALAVNVIAGIGLIVSASVSGLYWLRWRERPLQFSLRSLFALTTAAAVGVVLFRLSERFLGGWWVIFPLARLFLNASTCAVVATGAHWFVRRSARLNCQFRWLGLHVLTWLALILAGGPFLHHSITGWTGITWVGSSKKSTPGMIELRAHGWPAEWFGKHAPDADPDSLSKLGFTTSYVDPIALAVDGLAWLIAIVSVAFTVERIIRHWEAGTRGGWRTLVIWALITGSTFAIAYCDPAIPPRWYDYPSWLFTVACTVCGVGWLFFRAMPRVLRRKKYGSFAESLED